MIQKSLIPGSNFDACFILFGLFFSPCLLFLFHAFWENKLFIYFLNNFKSLFIFGCAGVFVAV